MLRLQAFPPTELHSLTLDASRVTCTYHHFCSSAFVMSGCKASIKSCCIDEGFKACIMSELNQPAEYVPRWKPSLKLLERPAGGLTALNGFEGSSWVASRLGRKAPPLQAPPLGCCKKAHLIVHAFLKLPVGAHFRLHLGVQELISWEVKATDYTEIKKSAASCMQ